MPGVMIAMRPEHVRVYNGGAHHVQIPSLELEMMTTRPHFEWNQESFYDELNDKLSVARSTLSGVLARSTTRIVERTRESAAFASLEAKSRVQACERTRHFNADPIDRTHVILHSSFHVLCAAQDFLAQPPKTRPASFAASAPITEPAMATAR